MRSFFKRPTKVNKEIQKAVEKNRRFFQEQIDYLREEMEDFLNNEIEEMNREVDDASDGTGGEKPEYFTAKAFRKMKQARKRLSQALSLAYSSLETSSHRPKKLS